MSLLDRNAPHVVGVQKRRPVKTMSGVAKYENDGDVVYHRCMVQVARDWSSAEESLTAGLQVYDMRVIYSRTWSGDEHSHIIWDGDLYEMIGAPQPLKASPRTAHWRVTCRLIGTAP